MSQLPVEYARYLDGKDQDVIDTVMPVFQQSMAEKLHGVHISIIPKGLQARLDDTLPYGTIVEDDD